MYVGEVAEWLKVPVWSTGVRVILHRGFESLPLRRMVKMKLYPHCRVNTLFGAGCFVARHILMPQHHTLQ